METVFVFDLDDTLYKEIDFVKSAYRHIANKISEIRFKTLPDSDTEIKNLENRIYNGMEDAFANGEDAFAVANSVAETDIPVKTFLEWYRFHLPDITLSPEVSSTLYALKQSGNRIALITDGRSRTQRNKIAALRLSDFIEPDDILISEEFGSEKPDERNYRYFSDRHKDSAGFIYVGDNIRKDFITPNRLGWKTIGIIDDGRNIHSRNVEIGKEYSPQMWLKSVSELKDLKIF